MDEKQAIKVEELDTIKPSSSGEVLFPHTNQYSHIRNKIIRNQKFQKTKRELKKVIIVIFYCTSHITRFFRLKRK